MKQKNQDGKNDISVNYSVFLHGEMEHLIKNRNYKKNMERQIRQKIERKRGLKIPLFS